MDEAYTCTCGDQYFLIMDGAIICCKKCGKTYGLMWLDDEVENPADFNERIRKEK